MNIPYTVEARPDTGLHNGKLGVWLFLASEVMLFGALFSSYILLRVGAPVWPHGNLSVTLGTINTIILISSSVTMVMAWASLKLNDWGKHRLYLSLTFLLAAVFLVNKYFEYREHFEAGEGPWHDTFFAIYFTLTGLHGLRGADGIHHHYGCCRALSFRHTDRDHDCAHHRNVEGIHGRRRLHASEPREEGDLRCVAADGRLLHRAAVSAAADEPRSHRSAALMSLRAFHLLFIAVSVVLAAFFAAWATHQYHVEHEIAYALAGLGSVAVAAALIVYGAAFQRKTKHLLVLLMVVAAPRAAFACPVCFGQSDSPMASAANLSILVMLIITVSVLAGFASFFIVLVRRARAAASSPPEGGHYVRRVHRVSGESGEGTVQC